jgi:hypothetical protein
VITLGPKNASRAFLSGFCGQDALHSTAKRILSVHLILCRSKRYLDGMLKRKLPAVREAEGSVANPAVRRLKNFSVIYKESQECPFQT